MLKIQEFYCRNDCGRHNSKDHCLKFPLLIIQSRYCPADGIKVISQLDFKKGDYQTSLAWVQWLTFHTSTTGGVSSIPGQRRYTCCALWQKKKGRLSWIAGMGRRQKQKTTEEFAREKWQKQGGEISTTRKM